MSQEWINRRGRIYWYDQYALNEQQTAFARYDPERITAELLSTGADIVAVYAANQFGIAYYPSAIWPQHPGLRGRDYFGDLCTRLQAHGVKVLAYINWLDSKHADWNMVRPGQDPAQAQAESPLVSWADPARPNGRVQDVPGGAWQFPCPLSPKRQQVVEVAREVVTRYHPDAFHLDMFHDVDICVCERCRPFLEEICGTSQLTRVALEAHWVEYVNWRCEQAAEVIAGVSRVAREAGIIAAHNAGVPLRPVANGFSESWLPWLDVFVSEAFDAFLCRGTDLNTTSILLRLLRGIGKPPWILRTSTQIHYAHWPISTAQWQLYAAACKANGGKVFGPCGVGAYPDTTSSQGMLQRVKQAFDFYMQDADLDEGAEPAARIALVFSWATRKYHDEHGAAGTVDWWEEFAGWARLLIEEHLPFEVVVAENLAGAAELAKYELVILPDTMYLGAACVTALREYVSRGGRLLATAESSLGDESGGRHADFALGDVLGIVHRGTARGPFAIERPLEPAPAAGLWQQVEALGAAETHAQVVSCGQVLARVVRVDPAGPVAGGKEPVPLEPTPWPAAISHTLGAGSSVYVAFGLGRFYELHGDEHIGTWMAELVTGLLSARQVTLHAPRTVEVTLWRQEAQKRTIVHLANRTVPWTLPTDNRQITQIIPVADVRLSMECPGPPGLSALFEPPAPHPQVTCRGAEIAWQLQGSQLQVTLARLEAYAAIVIAWTP